MLNHNHIKLFILITILAQINTSIVLKQIFAQEIVLNDNPSTDTWYSHVKKLDNDYIVVVWYDNSSTKLLFQVFDPVGRRQGTNKTVGTSAITFKRFIESLPSNKFIICYGANSGSGTINAQIYNYDGTVSGSSFVVNMDMPGIHEIAEVARLDNGGYVILWNKDDNSIYYKVFSASNTALTTSKLVLESASKKSCPSILSAPNNGFIICWREINGVTDRLLCRFFDTTGALGSTIVVDSFPTFTRDARMLSMKRLTNDNYIITYHIYPTPPDSYYSVINSTGTIVLGRTSINNLAFYALESPEVTSLSTGEILIVADGLTCSNCSINNYLQHYDASYVAVGTNTQINLNPSTTFNWLPSIDSLKNGGYAITWTSYNNYSSNSGYDIVLNIWYGDETNVTCADISVLMKAQANVAIDFGSNVTDDYVAGVKIAINALPTNGSFVLTGGSAVTAGTQYAYNGIGFNSDTNSGVYSVTYNAFDYFGNKSPSCNIIISVCYSSCETCSQVGTITDHKCLTCKIGYFQLGTSCSQTCPSSFGGYNYYNDASTNTCVKCTSPCNQCTSPTTCIDCMAGFIFIKSLTNNNCVDQCPTGYFKSGALCSKCDLLCTACLTSETDCTSCIPTAFQLKDKNQCLADCPDGYEADNQNNCVTCKSLNKYSTNGKCFSKCRPNTYPDINNICDICTKILYNGICYDTCPDGTMLDAVNKTCYKCSDRNLINYNNSCVQACPEGYYVNNGSCETCSANGMLLYNGACVLGCPAGTTQDPNLGTCVTISLTVQSKI
jgi:hypothetical protein